MDSTDNTKNVGFKTGQQGMVNKKDQKHMENQQIIQDMEFFP